MPSFVQMSLCDDFVAVAERAIKCTTSCKRLRTSPSLENSLWNVSPLQCVKSKLYNSHTSKTGVTHESSNEVLIIANYALNTHAH